MEKMRLLLPDSVLMKLPQALLSVLRRIRTKSIEEIHKYARDIWEKNFCWKVVRERLDEYYSDILKQYYGNRYSLKKKKIDFDEAIEINEELAQAGLTEEFILQRCCHYACLKKKLRKGKAYIWGVGRYGKAAKQLLDILFKQINLVSYIDMKKKGEYLGLSVIMPDEIAQDADYIFLGFAEEREQAIACLEQKGFRYHHSIWILP